MHDTTLPSYLTGADQHISVSPGDRVGSLFAAWLQEWSHGQSRSLANLAGKEIWEDFGDAGSSGEKQSTSDEMCGSGSDDRPTS